MMIKAEIKLSKTPHFLKVEKAEPPYLVINSEKDCEAIIEIVPIEVGPEATEEELSQINIKVIKLEEEEETVETV